jgi:hypothetical protein
MKTYIAKHRSKKAAESHIAAIEKRGGEILFQFSYIFNLKVSNILLIYFFKNDPKSKINKKLNSLYEALEVYYEFSEFKGINSSYKDRWGVYKSSRHSYKSFDDAVQWIYDNIDIKNYRIIIVCWENNKDQFIPYFAKKL